VEVKPLGQPPAPGGLQVIDGYGDGRFRISGVAHPGSVVVTPTLTFPWPVAAASEITSDSLAMLEGIDVQVLLIGCGHSAALLPKALREALRAKGVVAEAMDTGAACRTYNVLLAEERRVAAALIAVD
jgi:uncharacterized protein